MKRHTQPFLFLLSSLLTLSLLLSVLSPVSAASILNSQSWNLDILDEYMPPSDDDGLADQGLLQMEKYGGSGDNGQGVYIYDGGTGTWGYDHAGEIHLNANGDSQIWIADQAANGNVVFSGGEVWELELVTDRDWDPYDCGIRIGQWNGIKFLSFSTSRFTEPISWDVGPDKTVLHYEFQANSQIVFRNNYLAIEITNNDHSSTHVVYCGENLYSSCLTSPGSDPGYPDYPVIPQAPGLSWIGIGILTMGFSAVSILVLTRRRSHSN